LSSAQHKQAPAISNAPHPRCAPCAEPGSTKSIAPAKISSSTTRRSVFSRNTIHASNAVNTASRFSNSEAVTAGVRVKPSISANGPSTPPTPIASNSQNHSFLAIGATCQPRSE